MCGILTTHLLASNQKGIKFFCTLRRPNIQVNTDLWRGIQPGTLSKSSHNNHNTQL
jgi:hypothetical protein